MCNMTHNDKMILLLISLFAKARGISVCYAARLISGSGDTARKLEGGMSMTARRSERVVRNASAIWPEGAEWPSDIPRPAPKPAQDRAA